MPQNAATPSAGELHVRPVTARSTLAIALALALPLGVSAYSRDDGTAPVSTSGAQPAAADAASIQADLAR